MHPSGGSIRRLAHRVLSLGRWALQKTVAPGEGFSASAVGAERASARGLGRRFRAGCVCSTEPSSRLLLPAAGPRVPGRLSGGEPAAGAPFPVPGCWPPWPLGSLPPRGCALGREEIALCSRGQELSCLQLAAAQTLEPCQPPPPPRQHSPPPSRRPQLCLQLPGSDLDFSLPLSLC